MNTPNDPTTPEAIAKEMQRLKEADEYRKTHQEVPDGTCRIEIVGAPTTEVQCWALQWAFQSCVLFNEHFPADDPQRFEVIEQQGFSMPYNQGGGKITITRYENAAAYTEELINNAQMTREEWEDDNYQDDQWKENEPAFTGYVIHFNYSDSMTSPWESPIYYNEMSAVTGNAPFYLNEM